MKRLVAMFSNPLYLHFQRLSDIDLSVQHLYLRHWKVNSRWRNGVRMGPCIIPDCKNGLDLVRDEWKDHMRRIHSTPKALACPFNGE